jgi:hypothetical protein
LKISRFRKKSKKKKRLVWVRKWIARRYFGASDILLKELASEDPNSFKNHLRMSLEFFETLLRYIIPSIVFALQTAFV